MSGETYAVEMVVSDVDGLLRGSAIIGVGVSRSDGSILLDLRAVPVNGAELRLTPLAETSDQVVNERADARPDRKR